MAWSFRSKSIVPNSLLAVFTTSPVALAAGDPARELLSAGNGSGLSGADGDAEGAAEALTAASGARVSPPQPAITIPTAVTETTALTLVAVHMLGETLLRTLWCRRLCT